MTRAPKPTSAPYHVPSAASFGAHRQSDRPASAVRAGASTMPAAWQTRGDMHLSKPSRHDPPARNIADMLMDPLRWMASTKYHKIGSALVVLTALLVVVF